MNVLKYPGSKWRISKWIIEHFPKHHTYIEPYFGSGAVLFNKEQSAIESVNDLDDDVVNLFSCIRLDSAKLARLVALTPYSRKEYDLAFTQASDDFDRAVKFLVRCWQGHGFRTNGPKVGWKNDVQGRENMYAAYNWYRLPEWIQGTVDRLKQVQIDCQPATKFIQRHKYKNVLIYADPPYLLSTRSAKQYKHEMSEQDHVELIEVLLEHPGPVVLSGYHSDLYEQLLRGWHKETINGSAEYYGKSREEILWMNYEPPVRQFSMFD